MSDSIAGILTTCSRHEWTASDGERFPYSLWESATQPPRAVIVAVHGLSGAALDYEPLGRRFAGEGIATYALELRGQGNDPVAARRGDLVALEQWYADLRAFFALVRAQHPGTPVYYYGESMGAALLTRFLAQADSSDQPSGLILASPVIVVPGNPSPWRRLVFHVLLFVAPRRRVDVSKYTKRRDENDPGNWVTRDAAHRSWFETSSHRITSFTFRFFKCIFELMGGCMNAAPLVKVPLLVIYARHDVFIPPASVEAFFARLGSQEKEIELFPESYHLLLHDLDKDQALGRIRDWLEARLAEAPR
jgi:alpha-beta hydrolase superfamily lysophospholipase